MSCSLYCFSESNRQRRCRNGKVVFNGDVADQYGLRDDDGKKFDCLGKPVIM